VSLHGLEHAKAGLLHIGNSLILLLHELLVLSLELLDLGLEGILGTGELVLALLDLGVKVGIGESHGLLDRLLLVGIAQVEVGRTAGRSEVLLGEGGEVIVATAALVVLQVVGVTVLDGRVALDTVLAAQVLVHGAVDIGNESSLRVLEIFHELVPSRLHGFAVASPRGEELDEYRLAGSGRVEVVRGQLEGAHGSHEGEEDESTHLGVLSPCTLR